MNDQFRIKQRDHSKCEVEGPYTVDQLYRMRTKLELSHHCVYLSERSNAWLPITCLMTEDIGETIQRIKSTGIETAQILGSDAGDCEACLALEGLSFSVSETPPAIPPFHCTCNPWCRLTIIPSR